MKSSKTLHSTLLCRMVFMVFALCLCPMFAILLTPEFISVSLNSCICDRWYPYSPSSLSSSLHVFTGYPAMPIYWALGYHLCRWGYNTSNSTWDVVKSLRNYGIPQVKLTQQTVCLCVHMVFCFLLWNNNLCIDLFTGRPVEWHRLHGQIYGLHFWPNKVRHAAWSGQGPARSWSALRHDPGTQEFVFVLLCVLC